MAWDSSIIGSTDPGALYLGRYWNAREARVEGKLQYGGAHCLLLGRTGAGKGTRILAPNLLSLRDVSIAYVDIKCEGAAIAAPYRRTVSDVAVINPFGVLTDRYTDLASVGFNALAGIDPASPSFFDDVAAVAEAAIPVEGAQPHWTESARALFTGTAMGVVLEAARQGRVPSLVQVRMLLTEPDEYERGRPVRGMRANIARFCAPGHPAVNSLLGRFLRDSDEMASIVSTLDTHTQWMLSAPVAADIEGRGFDFTQLKKRPTTLFAVIPPERLETHKVLLRLIVSAVLRACYRPGGVPVLLIIDEAASLGRLQPVENALGLSRGFGLRMMLVYQSLVQARALFPEGAHENFVGQTTVIGFAPNDPFTADWMSKRSGELTTRQPNISNTQNPGGVGLSLGESYGRRPYLMPQDLFGLREGFGFVWAAGEARPVPIYAPPYYHVDTWRRRARANPFVTRDTGS